MLDIEKIFSLPAPGLLRLANMVILSPHGLLRPYIANYSLAVTASMAKGSTVLPTASNTLVFGVSERAIFSGLRGVNSKAVEIGGYAAGLGWMLLVEVHPGGLFPCLPIPQRELRDRAFAWSDLDSDLDGAMGRLLEGVDSTAALAAGLDALFLRRLNVTPGQRTVAAAMAMLQGGKDLATLRAELHYSEKQILRLFHRHVGTGPKTFSRILRLKRALALLGRGDLSLERVAWASGYQDGAHFSRDFSALCGVSPGAYRRKMSLFYNDPFKLEG